jgi:hypothetical protein
MCTKKPYSRWNTVFALLLHRICSFSFRKKCGSQTQQSGSAPVENLKSLIPPTGAEPVIGKIVVRGKQQDAVKSQHSIEHAGGQGRKAQKEASPYQPWGGRTAAQSPASHSKAEQTHRDGKGQINEGGAEEKLQHTNSSFLGRPGEKQNPNHSIWADNAIRMVIGRGDWIRTSGPFVPNEVLYQAEPHLDD